MVKVPLEFLPESLINLMLQYFKLSLLLAKITNLFLLTNDEILLFSQVINFTQPKNNFVIVFL